MMRKILTILFAFSAMYVMAQGSDADYTRLGQQAKVSADSVPAVLRDIVEREQSIRHTDRVEAAVLETLLSMQTTDSIAREYQRLALSDLDALAQARAKDYPKMVHRMSMGQYFNDDMLSVIGYELGEYDLLHDYYENHGCREAALLCALESLRQRGDSGTRKMEGSTYVGSLDSLMTVYGDLDLSGEIAIERYAFMDMASDVTPADKVSYLEKILNRYKKYERINILRNAYNAMTDPMSRMESFSYLLTSRDSLRLEFTHRNVSNATLRIYRTDMHNDEPDFEADDTELDKDGFREFRKTHKCKELSALRQEMVFREETLRTVMNDTLQVAPLPVGIYIVEIASSSKPKMEPLRHLLFVSDIRPLITPLPNDSCLITAVNALTGQPLTTAILQYVDDEEEETTTISADQHGQVYLDDDYIDCVLFTKDDHALPTFNPDDHSFFYDMKEENEEQVVGELMTDRSIYRPGQTVHLALVAYSQERCTTRVLPNQSFIVTVKNPQWKEIDSLSLTTDAFGTAHFEYRLPAHLPLGSYNLSIDKKRSGIKQRFHGSSSQTIRVEEYKRPTFKVCLDKSNDVVRIGDTLHLTGHAQTITGEPLRGATVTWSAFIRSFRQHSKMLRDECDTLMTDHEGRFVITLPIISQERYPVDDDIYRTEIHAYVTDAAGETHDVTENYQFTKRGIALSSNVQGKLIERRDLENYTITLKATNYCGNVVNIPLDYSLDGQSGQGNSFTAPQLGTGGHTLVITHEGDTLRQAFIVYDRDATRPCVSTSDWFDVSGSTFDEEGKEPCSVWIGTSERDVTIHYSVFTADSLLNQGLLHLSDSIIRQDYPYRDEYGDGITVVYSWYSNGEFHQEHASFEKPKPDKHLTAQWSTFRDKLMPGQKEEWRLKLTHQDGRPADARLIATLYDKSLDELSRHRWSWDTRLIRRLGDVAYYPESYRMNAYDYVHSKHAKEEELIMSWLNFGIGNYGQGVPVSGCVTDADGEPLIGASVMVAGTRIGTVTDIDGNYTMTAPAGSRLSFAYVGYKTKTLHVISHTINVVLEEDENALNEVVVVGYGVQKKSSLTGSIKGVAVEEPVIHVRGTNSDSGRQPLYVINGEIVNDISSIPSHAIVEMTTLSGSDATSIYGTQAAGGVIVITTNLGKQATSPSVPINIAMRENLSETAFFYPTLRTDSNGEVSIAFTLPESITTWQFLGSAHTRDMDHTIVEATTTAHQDLMVQPNMPRYLRSGDKGTLTARVSNTSDKTIKGTGVIQLIDPENDHIVYTSRQPFQVLADSVSSLTFSYTPSEQTPPLLTCKIAVIADGMSDGEQHYLPVLPSTEPQMKTFSFTMPTGTNTLINVSQLFPKGSTDRRFTFEYTNNPAWLMVEALHEYAHPYDDCAICQAMALFSQDIAASLGSHDEINAAIQRWNEEQDSVTVLSPLERNDDVKNILHAETPWLMAAKSEREQKQQLISLFNRDNQKKQHDKALNALRMLQNGDGSWSWFPGMAGSPYITHVVAELLVRSNALCGRHLETQPMLDEAFHYMATKGADLHYLYLCALDGRHPSDSLRREVRKEMKALRRDAKSNNISNIYTAAVKAIVLDAFKEKGAADLLDQIMSLTVTDRTLGRYFDSYLAPYSWLDYKIPTQVMVIEALERIRPNDQTTIDEMRQWLLQEKRSQYWVTPIQSANAIYAFLRGNMESLSSYPMPTISIDGQNVDDASATSTLGYVKTTRPATEANTITIDKRERHTSWGAVYAQYMQRGEDIEASGNDLQVHREVIAPHGGALRVGDKVRVRITLTAKRDLDFVQVNDRRAACLEAVDPLSGYRNGYYVQNRDCTTQYFISMLSKGTHVIEKEFYVDRAGTYHSGSITAQCAYAPEFCATAPVITLTVEK
ncbi:MAG: carboxypeptidase-like regulatory domain-containing protein [Prevotella sp.]|nr:carboxypeptidase-like regulatory domain-containing protein [Prevotella sp.]